jgi:crotonobetainyl-CoA:carnitine CoA-transferase CaiB-like acyl-CoA transferase
MKRFDGPLAGIKVVDLTHILAGPYCTQCLADAGATIIKVEPPGGEYARIRGPRRVGPDGTELSSYNAAVNRGKRSISLNLKNPAGLEVALRLIATADVVVENFAPGALGRLGLDLTAARTRDPRLITASISLYGGVETAGSLAKRGGLAIVAEGESTIISVTKDRSGVPVQLGVPLGDMASGVAAYAAIMTALYHRERTGQGQHLDISMVRALLALNSCAVTGAQIANANIFDLRTAAYGIFPASDGYVTIGVNNDSLFRRLVAVMGREELATDPRYASYRDRDQLCEEIDAMVSAWTSRFTVAEVIALISPSGVPCGRVATPGDVLNDPELAALDLFETVDDGLGGTIRAPRNAFGTRQPHYAIPRLAEHAAELLAETLDVDDTEFKDLSAAGAFGAAAVGF